MIQLTLKRYDSLKLDNKVDLVIGATSKTWHEGRKKQYLESLSKQSIYTSAKLTGVSTDRRVPALEILAQVGC